MELLPIGRFARLTGLTVRAVRHYGELEILLPAYVDPSTGYRYFAPDQIADALLIKRLRSVELGLDDIRAVIERDDPSFTRARLVRHRAKMAELAATTEQILATLQRFIEGEEELVPSAARDIKDDVQIKEVPACPVLVIRERAALDAAPEVILGAFQEIGEFLEQAGARPASTPLLICPYPDEDGLMELEIACPIEAEIAGRGRIENATLPACTVVAYVHRGAYDELDRSYRALETLLLRQRRELAGAPREIYLTRPQDVPDPNDWLTEIQFPIDADQTVAITEPGERSGSAS